MDEVRTGVDDLMNLLIEGRRMTIADAAKQLRQSEATVQNWVDFLVEEKILGIEYKFTTPYIYRNAPQRAVATTPVLETIVDIRRAFVENAHHKGIPEEKIAQLWEHHLLTVLETRRAFFRDECLKRNLFDTDGLFQRYTERLLHEHGLRHPA
jgi:hypothetical protein